MFCISTAKFAYFAERKAVIPVVVFFLFGMLLLNLSTAHAEEPLLVCATVPDLADLVRQIGGDKVKVTTFARGTEDPHFVQPKPSFLSCLSNADLFIQIGLELEAGWVPPLLRRAGNSRIAPGSRGFIDASTAVTPLDVRDGRLSRSFGDVHPLGNPHYLLDPLNAWSVAELLSSRLSLLRPDEAASFAENLSRYTQRIAEKLAGEPLAKKYDTRKLAALHAEGDLEAFLKSQGDLAKLGGWLGLLLPHRDKKLVVDHALWTYFAVRFRLQAAAELEPKPGIPPTTKHLSRVIQQMKAENIKVLLSTPYYDPKHANLVEQSTGAVVVEAAHQVEAREGADTYLEMIDHNVRALAEALSE